MNLKEKLAIVERAVTSISHHNDEDAQLIDSALQRVIAMVTAERETLSAKVAEDIKAKLPD